MPKLKWEDFKNSKEFKLWKNIKEVCDSLNLNEATYTSYKELNAEFWEPLLERIFKLGVFFKHTGKLKEIKIDWIRPIFYMGSEYKKMIEGKLNVPKKEAVDEANAVFRGLQHLITQINVVDKVNETNFIKERSQLITDCSFFFKQLIAFQKDGWRPLHENVKELLKPLRELRRAGYRLFVLEKREENNEELTLFQDKKALKEFTESIKQTFSNDEWKMKREDNPDKLSDFMNKAYSKGYYEYQFSEKKRVPENPMASSMTTMNVGRESHSPKRMNSIRSVANTGLPSITAEPKAKAGDVQMTTTNINVLLYPNIPQLALPEPSQFRRDALQRKFEEGLTCMMKYLYEQKKEDFMSPIDVHKIFVNLEKIPKGKELNQLKFFLSALDDLIEKMKIKLFEMKLNGLARVKLPVSQNTEIIDIIKKTYDQHILIDNLMGDKLKYDQYNFLYDCINFIYESTLKEELTKIKSPWFMEEAIPKYVAYCAIRHAAHVMDKMCKEARQVGKYFKYEDYFQIINHKLDSDENLLINEYELNDMMKRFMTKDIQALGETLYQEIGKYGRLWVLEGFFPPADQPLWLKAIEILRSVNSLVQDDIRDYILNSNQFDELPKMRQQASASVLNESGNQGKPKRYNVSQQKSIKNSNNTSINARERAPSGKKKTIHKPRLQEKHTESDDDSILVIQGKIPHKLDGLRPPNVWNYPIQILQDIRNSRLKKTEDAQILNEIRVIDPQLFYKDKRIVRFMEILHVIKKNMMEYCNNQKGRWGYYFEKILSTYPIQYTFIGYDRKSVSKTENIGN